MQAAIYGLAGETLTEDERDFFRDADPSGYILFRRNCVGPAQLRSLTDSLRSLHGRDDLPILIDQEGGRVARLAPPEWPEFPAAARFAELFERAPMTAIEAARANAQAIAALLHEAGITVDCLPLLDLRYVGANAIVGDRALGAEPMQVAALGRAVIEGLRSGGVAAVIKHMPGHGRATSDSHRELPVVSATDADLERDLSPFQALRDAAIGMTAHVVYTAWDAERCASVSPVVIDEIIRSRIGFEGWLISDDIGMDALSGSFAERARAVAEGGCDAALHCSGIMAEMIDVAAGVGEVTAGARARLGRAMATLVGIEPTIAYEEAAARRDSLLAVL